MQYEFLKKGMQMHPFSDQSGVAFYRSDTTVVTSIGLPLSTIEAFMAKPNAEDEKSRLVLDELESNGFIVKVVP
jgi:hypothetical protein